MKYNDIIKNEKFILIKKLWFILLLILFFIVLYNKDISNMYHINVGILLTLLPYLTVLSIFYLILEIVLIYYSKSKSDEIISLNLDNEKYIIECFFILTYFLFFMWLKFQLSIPDFLFFFWKILIELINFFFINIK